VPHSSLFHTLHLSRAPSRPPLPRRQLMSSLGHRTPHPSPPVLKLTPPLLPSPVGRGSASPRSSVSHASPLYSPLAAAEGREDHRSPPPPQKHRRPEPTPSPLHHAAASVRLHQSHLARHLPLFLRDLSPPVLPHLVARLDAVGHASPPPRMWPPRGDHGQRTRRVLPEPVGPSWLLGHASRAVRP
jgi:hypothetical protein